jgi:hypothetical protein
MKRGQNNKYDTIIKTLGLVQVWSLDQCHSALGFLSKSSICDEQNTILTFPPHSIYTLLDNFEARIETYTSKGPDHLFRFHMRYTAEIFRIFMVEKFSCLSLVEPKNLPGCPKPRAR